MDRVGNVLALIILSLVIIQRSDAVQYKVVNNVTNVLYGDLIILGVGGVEFSKKTMKSATDFVLRTLRETKSEDLRKDVPRVIGLFFQDMDGSAATTLQDGIHMSVGYIARYLSSDVRKEFVGVILHEMTHVWQWFGDDRTPVGLTEGIADYVRLRAGYARIDWVKPGEGDRWDQGYDVTARFLDYCEGLKDGFVSEMNKRLKTFYKDEYFIEILGKDVHRLWREYKAKYNSTRNHRRPSNRP
ncbi:hypothetical protein MLD38_013412 [Melastoma candidum]|uniref:Uncharacterized protein n=1 Tax=Melastoma candidum TaxID=119954 RepID=A0ACB9R8W6_9MYRT|nr:hypothetical protein MLD38_013412 [Melastoma candidum]